MPASSRPAAAKLEHGRNDRRDNSVVCRSLGCAV